MQNTLKVSWWLLFLSRISIVLVQFITISRDYRLGKSWKDKLQGKEVDTSGKHGIWDILIWASGIIGLLSFIGGLLSLAYVSTQFINAT